MLRPLRAGPGVLRAPDRSHGSGGIIARGAREGTGLSPAGLSGGRGGFRHQGPRARFRRPRDPPRTAGGRAHQHRGPRPAHHPRPGRLPGTEPARNASSGCRPTGSSSAMSRCSTRGGWGGMMAVPSSGDATGRRATMREAAAPDATRDRGKGGAGPGRPEIPTVSTGRGPRARGGGCPRRVAVARSRWRSAATVRRRPSTG